MIVLRVDAVYTNMGKTTRKQIQLEKATKKAYRDHEIIVPLKLEVSESQISKEFSFL